MLAPDPLRSRAAPLVAAAYEQDVSFSCVWHEFLYVNSIENDSA